MSFITLLILASIAGFTIFLGIPIATLKGLKSTTKGVLSGIATGILLFLTVEILGSKVLEAGEGAVEQLVQGKGDTVQNILLVVFLVAGVFAGLIGIPWIEKVLIKPLVARFKKKNEAAKSSDETQAAQEQHQENAYMLSLSIALGIGLHNFGEGLAIGQSAASGAISLAIVLIIGFGLHNMTEGFGIAAPLTGFKPKLSFLFLAGLIGGGPTFVGTLIGASWTSPLAMIISLSLAGGSLAFVTLELLMHGRHALKKIPLMSSVGFGFFLAYGTDLIVSLAGA